MEKLGKHCVTEVYGCSALLLNDVEFLKNAFVDAINKSKATLLNISYHQFDPHGITMVALLSESHLSIHTWPERQCAAIDAFTCGDCDPRPAILHLVMELQSSNHKTNCFDR